MAPVIADATLPPGTNANPNDPKSATNAPISALSARVQFFPPISVIPAAFFGFTSLELTLTSVTPVDSLEPPALPPS